MLFLQKNQKMMSRLLVISAMVLLLLQSAAVCAQSMESGHLYAVLVNGGRNRLTNHERYWNDCAFLYRTLRQTFRIPKRNITVLMSDGGNPAEDMLRTDGRGFISSPPDLDGDRERDVAYPAGRQTLINVLFDLAMKLTDEDHLFLFVTDHGGSDDKTTDSFVWLWDDERLEDYSLASLLGLFRVSSINVLMGQCYSGGFIDNLMRDRLIIATACSGSEPSWVSPDGPYDEFVYQWTCAVNGSDIKGNAVNADADGNGQVSMREAFEYAQSHDRTNETPQYGSWPEQLGEQWTFTNTNQGTLGIDEVKTEDQEQPAIWTVSGIRQQKAKTHSVYIERRGRKVRKIVK